MAQVNDMNTEHESRYETPTFDPRGAFARTLRGGEIARLGRLDRQKGLPTPSELAGDEPNAARAVNGTARRYETPTFDPRGGFARTLRGGEMARLERRQRLFDRNQLDALACAA
jgi:hypothetical protein